jgi:hypothetical protein
MAAAVPHTSEGEEQAGEVDQPPAGESLDRRHRAESLLVPEALLQTQTGKSRKAVEAIVIVVQPNRAT